MVTRRRHGATRAYQGVDKRPENRGCDVAWQVAMKPGKRRLLDRDGAEAAAEKLARASVRAKVEHPFLYDEAALRVR